MEFEDSYIGSLRKLVGHQKLLIPGARIVIQNSADEILLQLRSDFKVWGVPGGSSDPGESVSQTIVREVREETGLEIANFVPFGFSSTPEADTVVFPNGDEAQFFTLNFWTRDYAGVLKPDASETLELAWFALDELPEMLPNMALMVDAFQEYQASGQFQLF